MSIARWSLLAALGASMAFDAHAQTTTLPPPVSYSTPTTGSVSSSATLVAVPGLKITQICNTTALGGGNIWLNPAGGTATVGAGNEAAVTQISGGMGGCVTYSGQVRNTNGNIITGVCDSGTCNYTLTVGN
jgi:hypothetical protein